ncbi:MAG: hypothetical protein OXP75_19840 [Rhodospirillales bacterium]|nr:hypothetical protein [Rhodospirillales bacterium]
MPVGRDGVFEAFCPPYHADMDAAVDAATAQASPEGIQCVKDICGYILDTFGKFPATVDPIQLTLMI